MRTLLLGLPLKQAEAILGEAGISPQVRVTDAPRHVAIIMDGNGRWAQKRGMPRTFGHKAGVEALREIIKYSDELGVEALTVYAFSAENWKRSTEEVGALMRL